MTTTLNLNVGDLVVRYGKILKVFQINQDTVNLHPFFNFNSNNDLTFTLNLENTNGGTIRQLVSKNKIKTLLNLIIKKTAINSGSPVFDSKTALSQNQLEETLWVIKVLWLEKQKSDSLSSGKSTIFRKAMTQATEEIAAANHTSPEKAELLILSGLKG